MSTVRKQNRTLTQKFGRPKFRVWNHHNFVNILVSSLIFSADCRECTIQRAAYVCTNVNNTANNNPRNLPTRRAAIPSSKRCKSLEQCANAPSARTSCGPSAVSTVARVTRNWVMGRRLGGAVGLTLRPQEDGVTIINVHLCYTTIPSLPRSGRHIARVVYSCHPRFK